MSLTLSLSRARPSVSGSVSGSLNFSTSSPAKKAYPTYTSNGYVMNSAGYLANPSRQAQIQARDAGALTNAEAHRMGLSNRR
jgi:hypothetical protein